MAIKHINLISLPVSDQGRARHFYVDMLGLDLIADNAMEPDRRWVQVGPKPGRTSITVTFDDPDGNGIVLRESRRTS